jgi:hypothetical protein
MLKDFFGITDRIKSLIPPEGFEDVHQDGMSWPKQGASYLDTTRIGHVDWSRLIAQFRGLLNAPSVDVSDLPETSNLLLREFIERFAAMKILEILSGTDVGGYGLLDKPTYDPNDDGIIGMSAGGTGVAASSVTDLRDQLGITSAINAAINALIAAAPGALDTLNELAAALGDDANFAATINAALGNRLRIDTAQGLTVAQRLQAKNNIDANTSLCRPVGLIVSNDTSDPTNDLGFSSGSALSEEGSFVRLVLAAPVTRQLDVAYGTGNGGRFDSAISDGTWHAFLIGNGTLFGIGLSKSLNPTSQPNYPAGYNYYRRIASIPRVTGALRSFKQLGNGDLFWTGALAIRSSTAAFADGLLTLNTPVGIVTSPLMGAFIQTAASSFCNVKFGNGTDTVAEWQAISANAGAQIMASIPPGALFTDTSARIRMLVDILSGTISNGITWCYGWTDARGA